MSSGAGIAIGIAVIVIGLAAGVGLGIWDDRRRQRHATAFQQRVAALPEGERDERPLTIRDVERLAALLKPASPPHPSVWTWLVPALLVFLGVLVTATASFFKEQAQTPVDCVAYVNSIEELHKDFPDRTLDLDHLKDLYGDRTIEECGSPSELFAG